MQERHAVTLALIMSGKYNLSGQSMTIRGYDAYGNEMTETTPVVDSARLEADVQAVMDGRMPSPIKQISCISCGD